MSLQINEASATQDGCPGEYTATTAAPVAVAGIEHRGRISLRITPRFAKSPVETTLKYRWIGRQGAPTVIVLGGISAGRDVCAHAQGQGWWEDVVGEDRAVDLAHWQVLSIDWLETAELPGARAVSSEDQADALAALLDALDISQVHSVVGASYGAMVGLAFAARHRRRVNRLIAISGAHRAHPLATALRSIQRQIIRQGIASGAVAPALALARQLAMTTYRGETEFAQRFDSAPQWRDGQYHFAVEDYLAAAGEKFVARFDAQRYLSLSESIDLHRIAPESIDVPTTLIGIDSDRLVPEPDLRELASALKSARLHRLESKYGHDAFLKEPQRIGALIRAALNSTADFGVTENLS